MKKICCDDSLYFLIVMNRFSTLNDGIKEATDILNFAKVHEGSN